jgi:hypothetical protein
MWTAIAKHSLSLVGGPTGVTERDVTEGSHRTIRIGEDYLRWLGERIRRDPSRWLRLGATAAP